MKEHIDSIRRQLPLDELLTQLAEECCELAQAALKLRRAVDGKNPTPVTIAEAQEKLDEEIADVFLVLDAIGIGVSNSTLRTMEEKAARWVQRLKEVRE